MEGYYSDGITKYTDPLWVAVCPECGHNHWSVMKIGTCPNCGFMNLQCTNSSVEKRLIERGILVETINKVR